MPDMVPGPAQRRCVEALRSPGTIAVVRDRAFTSIETKRVVLRRFQPRDADAFAAYRALPEIARFQSWQGFTREDAKRFIAEMQSSDPGIPGSWFQFAIAERASDALMGDCALALDAGDPPSAEIGYTLDPRFHGQGLAAEAVGAMLRYAYTKLDVATVRAVTDVRNVSSISVAQRLGMRCVATLTTTFKGETCDEQTYELTRDAWQDD
jgi:RimJ/RimL family protein N-acetyltransferase